MILGEHAVLHGRRALVGAVDRRVRVSLRQRTDRIINIRSALGQWAGNMEEAEVSGPFRFVIAALKSHPEGRKGGLDVEITSDLPATVGLGSSAAVTVATLAAHGVLRGHPVRPDELHRDALRIIRDVQGLGSGADAAASVFGGIVLYRAEPVSIRAVSKMFAATLVYSGAKTPTPEVVRFVESLRVKEPDRFERIFDRIDESVDDGVRAIESGDWEELGAILDRSQACMAEMGVSNNALDDILRRLQDEPGAAGAKISGSGLGDCVLAVGSVRAADWPYECIPISFASEGVCVD